MKKLKLNIGKQKKPQPQKQSTQPAVIQQLNKSDLPAEAKNPLLRLDAANGASIRAGRDMIRAVLAGDLEKYEHAARSLDRSYAGAAEQLQLINDLVGADDSVSEETEQDEAGVS